MDWADELYREESAYLSELVLSGDIDDEMYEEAIESLKATHRSVTGREPREAWESDPEHGEEDNGPYADGT